jgi:hypothetical protein
MEHNVQRQVTITGSIRVMRPEAVDHLANMNLNQLDINVHNLESDLQDSFGNFIMETLTAEYNLYLENSFIMRPHSDINVVVRRREPPDVNVFDVTANFTIKYNNVDFWDYEDRFEDSEINALGDSFADYADIPQIINEVEFFRIVQDLDIRMGDEQPFVPIVIPQLGGGRRARRSRRRARRARRASRRRT